MKISERDLSLDKNYVYASGIAEKIDEYVQNFSICDQYIFKNAGNYFKNILIINTMDAKGGAAKIADQIFTDFKKNNYNAKLFVGYKLGNKKDVYEIKRDNFFDQKCLSLFQEEEGWLDFFHYSSLDMIKSKVFSDADIIHLHNLHGNYFSFFALPKICSIKPVIWTLHDMHAITGHCAHSFDCNRWIAGCGNCQQLSIYPSVKNDYTDFIWKLKEELYKTLNFTIVCPSNWLRKKVDKSILKDKKIEVIHNGVNENIFKNIEKSLARRKLGLPDNKKILFFCADGGLSNPWKGTKHIYSAYKYFYKKDDLLFINVGSIGHENKRNWINVEYINNEKIMALYYAAADLFIYPSLADNCPLSVLEALSCGTPVITFNTGGIPELINHKKNGYLAKYDDENDFIKGIEVFFNDDKLMKYASENARKTVEDFFTIDKMIIKYKKLYAKVYKEYYNNKIKEESIGIMKIKKMIDINLIKSYDRKIFYMIKQNQEKINRIHNSMTYKIGKLFISPLKFLTQRNK